MGYGRLVFDGTAFVNFLLLLDIVGVPFNSVFQTISHVRRDLLFKHLSMHITRSFNR